jgi:hypothetical protein
MSDKNSDEREKRRMEHQARVHARKGSAKVKFYYMVYQVFYKPPKDKTKLVQIEELSIHTQTTEEEPAMNDNVKAQLIKKIHKKYEDDPLLDRIQTYEPIFNDSSDAELFILKLK